MLGTVKDTKPNVNFTVTVQSEDGKELTKAQTKCKRNYTTDLYSFVAGVWCPMHDFKCLPVGISTYYYDQTEPTISSETNESVKWPPRLDIAVSLPNYILTETPLAQV